MKPRRRWRQRWQWSEPWRPPSPAPYDWARLGPFDWQTLNSWPA